jgi:Flp pilus assembly protein TadD
MNRAERRRQKKLSHKHTPSKALEKTGVATAQEALQRGVEFHQLRRLDEAIHWYRKSLELQPDNSTVLNNLGIALKAQGQLDAAITSYQQAISVRPNYVQAHSNLGNALKDQGNLDAAVSCYRQAISLKPGYAQAYSNLGNLLQSQGRLDEAVSILQKAIVLKPNYAQAHNNLGLSLKKQGRLDEAVSILQKAIALKPNYAQAHNNLGNALNEQGKFSAALASYRQAIAIKPGYANAHYNLGSLLTNQGKFEKAQKALHRAISLDPGLMEARHNMGFVNLSLGKFDAGWKEYELRLLSKPDQHNFFSFPRWHGEPLDEKTVLVYAEQGVGDEITFSLLFPEFAALTKRCIVLCDPRLESLFLRSFPGIEVMGVARDQYPTIHQRLPPIDYQVAAGSLAKFIRPGLDGLKTHLLANPERIAYWRQRFAALGPEPKIGISWSTSDQSGLRMSSHPRLEHWGPILTVPGVTFINLFYGNATEDIEAARGSFKANIIDLGGKEIDLRDDLDELYAMMSALDLVVTTPSTVATLSCNLGSKSYYFYSLISLWRTLGADSIPWFMDAEPLFFAHLDEFASVAKKVGEKIRTLAVAD